MRMFGIKLESYFSVKLLKFYNIFKARKSSALYSRSGFLTLMKDNDDKVLAKSYKIPRISSIK